MSLTGFLGKKKYDMGSYSSYYKYVEGRLTVLVISFI